jgi:uncharacterized glyoxalase superfamily protein PhnB
MSKPYKPEGYNSVSPYLVVDNARAVMAFLEAAFDAVPLECYEKPDGSILHAAVSVDDTVVMLADAPAGYTPVRAVLHFYVPDVDATYQRALSAGGEPIQEPMRKDDPSRRGGVRDPAGNAWWIATPED